MSGRTVQFVPSCRTEKGRADDKCAGEGGGTRFDGAFENSDDCGIFDDHPGLFDFEKKIKLSLCLSLSRARPCFVLAQ